MNMLSPEAARSPIATRRASARNVLIAASRYGLVLAIGAALLFFALRAPGFAQPANLRGLLVNNFALLAITGIALTVAVHSGGFDLSVATAIDVASLAFVSCCAAQLPVWVAILTGLGAALTCGLFNALLISLVGIPPFLATLGTLFIGHSAQQLATHGGNPVYVPFAHVPAALPLLSHGDVLGVPVPVLVALVLAVLVHVLLARTLFGRRNAAIGAQPVLATYSGLPVRATLAIVYALVAVIAGTAGILLSANVNAYMPFSGNVFMMSATGATYIGSMMSRTRAANVPGTLAGALFLGIVANGLLLVGWDFYWQQVGSGVAILLCLVFSYGVRRVPR